jgi:hypothetical protein
MLRDEFKKNERSQNLNDVFVAPLLSPQAMIKKRLIQSVKVQDEMSVPNMSMVELAEYEQGQKQQIAKSSSTNKGRILIVDDE